ncbi:MAG: hypothetical protein ACI9J3_003490 [Parvicellaceae bacterium]|jgi:hypothetical protein
MKKVVALIALVFAIGFANAQQITPSVQQKVDAKISQWADKLSVTGEQLVEITAIMVKYESMIENQLIEGKKNKTEAAAVSEKVANYKKLMNSELMAKLTAEQKKIVNSHAKTEQPAESK